MAARQVLQNYDLCDKCRALPGADAAAPYTELRAAEPCAANNACPVRTFPGFCIS